MKPSLLLFLLLLPALPVSSQLEGPGTELKKSNPKKRKPFSIFKHEAPNLWSNFILALFSVNRFCTFLITKLKFILQVGLLHPWHEIVEAVKEGSETLNTIVPILAIFIFGGIIGYAIYIAYNNYVVNTENGLIVVNSWYVLTIRCQIIYKAHLWKKGRDFTCVTISNV